MRIIAFSDWRIQSIDKLIDYFGNLEEKPDLIVYAGDDISRFNRSTGAKDVRKTHGSRNEMMSSVNYFEELARYSNNGLLVVAGNDDSPNDVKSIRGKRVLNIHNNPVKVKGRVFIGLEGAVKPPGPLIHTELEIREVLKRLPKSASLCDKVVVSHTPPYDVLDLALRFGLDHIGSVSLREFIERNRNVKLVICGHVHFCGGQNRRIGECEVVNCASHDNPGEPGKIAIIDLDKNEISVKWEHICDWGVLRLWQLDGLMNIPLVGYPRAVTLYEKGCRNAGDVANLDLNGKIAKSRRFSGAIGLIVNYARAIHENKPIVVGVQPFFRDLDMENVWFVDMEYDPIGTIFLIGKMNLKGQLHQSFLDIRENHRKLIMKFLTWYKEESPTLVPYASTSAEEPILRRILPRYGIDPSQLGGMFFDLYYDCICTQRMADQYIFLPIRGIPESKIGLKHVSNVLGYRARRLAIEDGLEALLAYLTYSQSKNKVERQRIKADLMDYNKEDLLRTKFVFERIRDFMAVGK